MDLNLAEICGIIAGDGHLNRSIEPRRSCYKISVFGHREDDLHYFYGLQDLFEKTFQKKPLLKDRKRYLELRLHSKEILLKLERIGIPVGAKSGKIRMPERIKESKELRLSFLRGFADTDFSVVKYNF